MGAYVLSPPEVELWGGGLEDCHAQNIIVCHWTKELHKATCCNVRRSHFYRLMYSLADSSSSSLFRAGSQNFVNDFPAFYPFCADVASNSFEPRIRMCAVSILCSHNFVASCWINWQRMSPLAQSLTVWSFRHTEFPHHPVLAVFSHSSVTVASPPFHRIHVICLSSASFAFWFVSVLGYLFVWPIAS